MAQPTPVPVPLEQTREHVIQQLTAHFAHDNLSIEALEERLDRAHQATTLDDLRALVSDLPVVAADAAPAPSPRLARHPARTVMHTALMGRTVPGLAGARNRHRSGP